MRIFFAISLEGLDKYSFAGSSAHAVTDELRRAFPDEEDEELDMIALLAAADDNIRQVKNEPFRLVVAADAHVDTIGTAEDPSLVQPTDAIVWSDVAAIFTDEETAADDVLAARRGNDEAFDRLAGQDMLWYDPTERLRLAADLRGRMNRQYR